MTILTLTNGKRVANFSSPHDFVFTDGRVLPAVSDYESERLKVTFIESIDDNGDVELSFDLSMEVRIEMTKYIDLFHLGQVDVVFCPLPMMTAMYKYYSKDTIKRYPFRSVRIEDRIKKLVSIDKQCL